MTPNELKARTRQFAIEVVRFAKNVPRDPSNNVIVAQLTRSGTATASAYRAVCRARSTPDFIYKLGNAIEEADESELWLDILSATGCCAPAAAASLRREADELTRIFVASRETALRDNPPRPRHIRINQQSKIKDQK
jgi:four helix bundle protein